MTKQPARVVTAISVYFLRNEEFRKRVIRRVGPTEKALVHAVLDAAIEVALTGIYKPDPYDLPPKEASTKCD